MYFKMLDSLQKILEVKAASKKNNLALKFTLAKMTQKNAHHCKENANIA